jgi:hypothetical protein
MPGQRLPISSLLRTIPIYPRKSTSKQVGTVTWSVRPPARPPCSWLCICHATLSGRCRRHFPQPNHPTLAPNSAPFSSSSLIAPKSCCLLASLEFFFLALVMHESPHAHAMKTGGKTSNRESHLMLYAYQPILVFFPSARELQRGWDGTHQLCSHYLVVWICEL